MKAYKVDVDDTYVFIGMLHSVIGHHGWLE